MKFELGNKTTYNNLSDKTFKLSLNKLLPSQPEIEMNYYLSKFDDFKWKENKKISLQSYEVTMKDIEDKKFEKKRILNKSQRLNSFNQLFEQNGTKVWEKNILIRKEKILKDMKFQLDEAKKIHTRINGLIKSDELKMVSSIVCIRQLFFETIY